MATLLLITVLLPFLGSLLLVLLPKLEFQTARAIALATALVTLFFSLILLWAFDSEVRAPQFAFSGAATWDSSGWEGPTYDSRSGSTGFRSGFSF